MARMCIFLFTALLLTHTARSQDKPKPDSPNDPVAAELKKAKEIYQVAVEQAAAKLRMKFDGDLKRLKEDTKFAVEERIKRIEQVQDELKAFDADASLPQYPTLKAAGLEYRAAVATARTKCEKAFDVAADKYVKTDLAAAKAVLEEKKTFFLAKPTATEKAATEKDARTSWRNTDLGYTQFNVVSGKSWAENDSKTGKPYKKWIEVENTNDSITLQQQDGTDHFVKLYQDRIAWRDQGVWRAGPKGSWTALAQEDVTTSLAGIWEVSFVGKTKGGSKIDYQASWEFKTDGVVRSITANQLGSWVYDVKKRQIVITWANAEKSQESFPVPLNPTGLVGQTHHGDGVIFTAKKQQQKDAALNKRKDFKELDNDALKLFKDGKYDEAYKIWRYIHNDYPRTEFQNLGEQDPRFIEWRIFFYASIVREGLASKHALLQKANDEAVKAKANKVYDDAVALSREMMRRSNVAKDEQDKLIKLASSPLLEALK